MNDQLTLHVVNGHFNMKTNALLIYLFFDTNQWRIKVFLLRGARTPKVGVLTYYFGNFC